MYKLLSLETPYLKSFSESNGMDQNSLLNSKTNFSFSAARVFSGHLPIHERPLPPLLGVYCRFLYSWIDSAQRSSVDRVVRQRGAIDLPG